MLWSLTQRLAALVGLIVLLPLLLILGLAVRATSPGPALFRQARVGRKGQPFEMVKLRTMTVGQAGPTVTASSDARITRLGRWLRVWKLDELPELWNVVRGEMALVGPRPEVPAWVDLHDSRWQRVLEALPGITDPVTLSLRNEEEVLASVEDPERYYREVLQPRKIDGYLEYLDRRTVASDVGVILATLARIVLNRPRMD